MIPLYMIAKFWPIYGAILLWNVYQAVVIGDRFVIYGDICFVSHLVAY